MRALLYINLIAVVVLAGALGRVYEGTPLPWVMPASTPIVSAESPPRAASSSAAAPATPSSVAPAGSPHSQPTPASMLRILTEGDYPPFNYRGADGLLTGFDIELARALCQRMKRDCRFEVHRWIDLLPLLARGQGDAVMASMLVPSPGREAAAAGKGIVFMRYYSTPGHFVARKGDAPIAASATALAGKRVAVQSGSIHEAFLKGHFPSVVIVGAPSLEEAEKSLMDRRAEILFADRNALLRWVKTRPGASCCRLVGTDYTDPAFFGSGAGIALRASDPDLRSEFENALQGLIDDGTYASISLRYFGQNIR